MGNIGGPSRGCLTCIARKIRCDQQLPECSQCRRSRRQCRGYRKTTDILFRDQTQSVVAKMDNSTPSTPDAVISGPMPTMYPGVRPSRDNFAIEYFMINFTCSGGLESRDNFFWMPADSALWSGNQLVRSSVVAVGSMAIARLQRSKNHVQQAQQQYCTALNALAKHWRHALQTDPSSTFLVVFLLSFFEILASYDESSRHAWKTHLDGLASMFCEHNRYILRTPVGARLYRQVRAQIILHALLNRLPVLDVFDKAEQHELDPPVQPFAAVFAYLARLANLQASCYAPATSLDLIPRLQELDAQLANWSAALPTSWHFVQHDYYQPTSWWDVRCDSYPSGAITYTWNQVRTARCMIYDLQCLLLGTQPQQSTERKGNLLHGDIRSVVIDICSTVPAYYRPNNIDRSAQRPPVGSVFWMLWPLEVLGSMSHTPTDLRNWIVGCLQRMCKETGILKAQVAADRVRRRSDSISAIRAREM